MINYPSFYNSAVKLYNENSFERLYKDPIASKKSLMLGGKFLQRKLIVFTYVILIIATFIVFNVTKHVSGNIVFGVAFSLSVLYVIFHIYNLIVYCKNGYIIGENFLEDESSTYIDEKSFYKLYLINTPNEQEITKFEKQAEFIHYLIDRYKITDGQFFLVFYKKNLYEYTNCAVIFYHIFFSALVLACLILNLLHVLGKLK